jgi:hypothetical protein
MDRTMLVARGGAGGTRMGGAGGSWAVSPSLTSSGGAVGGQGGFQSWDSVLGDLSGGGGGCGGYSGEQACSHAEQQGTMPYPTSAHQLNMVVT